MKIFCFLNIWTLFHAFCTILTLSKRVLKRLRKLKHQTHFSIWTGRKAYFAEQNKSIQYEPKLESIELNHYYVDTALNLKQKM